MVESAIEARKLVITAPGQIGFERLALPQPEPGQVLARSFLSGISHGTEMTAYLGTSPFVEKTITKHRTFQPRVDGAAFYPFRYAGYELIGEVIALGEGVENFCIGDRVWFPAQHQTHFVFEANDPQAFRFSASFPLEAGAMINLSSIALGAVLDAEVKLGDTVVVFGGGTVGQLVVQLAFLSGAQRVFLVEPSEERRAFATAKSAVETFDSQDGNLVSVLLSRNEGRSPDVVIECSGTIPGLRGALQAAGVAGRVVAAGFFAGGTAGLTLGEEFLHNRITLLPSMWVWDCPSRWPERWDRNRLLHQAFHLLESGRLIVEGFVTSRFPFENAQEAYEAIAREPHKHMKAVLTFAA